MTGTGQATVTGATRLYAIIGDPIEQVRSPEVLIPHFAAAGLNAVLVPVHVRPERFDETVRGLMSPGDGIAHGVGWIDAGCAGHRRHSQAGDDGISRCSARARLPDL